MSKLLPEEKLTNTAVSIVRVYFRHDDIERGIPAYVEACVQVHPCKPAHWNVPVADFNAHQLQADFPTCVCYGKGGVKKMTNRLKETLAEFLAQPMTDENSGICFAQTGLHRLRDGTVCFVAGNEVLGHSPPYLLVGTPCCLQWAAEEPADDAGVTRWLRRMKASPVLMTIFIFTLISAIQTEITKLGIPFQAVLYLYGRAGCGKTTAVRRAGCVYNGTDSKSPVGFFEAGSSAASIREALSDYRGSCVVVDDLCLTSSSKLKRQRIDLASEILYEAANKSPVSKKWNGSRSELTCTAGLILTAEFILEAESELNRCILLPVKRQSGGSEEDRSLASCAFRRYIMWITEHINEELTDLRILYRNFLNAPDRDRTEERIATNYFVLNWMFSSFQRFIKSCGLLSEREQTSLAAVWESMWRMLKQNQLHQLKRAKRNVPKKDLFNVIIDLVDKKLDMKKDIKKLKRCDGIYYKKDICIRPTALLKALNQVNGYRQWTQTELSRQLAKEDILHMQGNNGYTVVLQKKSPRVYRIRVDKLIEAAKRHKKEVAAEV